MKITKKFDPATQYLLLRMTEFKLKRNLDRAQLRRRNEIVVVPVVVPIYISPAARPSPPRLPATEFLRPTLENRGDIFFSEKKGGAGYKWGGGGLSIFDGLRALTPDILVYALHVYEVDETGASQFWDVVTRIATDEDIISETRRFSQAAGQVAEEIVSMQTGQDVEMGLGDLLDSATALGLRTAGLIGATLTEARVQPLGTASGELRRDENYALNPDRPVRKRRKRHKDPGGFVLKLKTEFKSY